MKTLLKSVFLILIALVIFSQKIAAQGFENIANAIKAGDAVTLAKYFEGNVEISLKDAQNSYSKSQAEVVLKNFFSTHSPKSFSIAHQGTSPEGSKYFIGNLATGSGTYRTYVYAKQVGGTFQIQEIRFEDQ